MSRIPAPSLRTTSGAPTGADLKGFTDWLRRYVPDALTTIASHTTTLASHATTLASHTVTLASHTVSLLLKANKRLNIFETSSSTLTLTDAYADYYVRCTHASGCTVTVNAGEFTTGDVVHLRATQDQLEIVEGTDVTVNTAETLFSRKAMSPLMLVCLNTDGDEFDLFGDLELV